MRRYYLCVFVWYDIIRDSKNTYINVLGSPYNTEKKTSRLKYCRTTIFWYDGVISYNTALSVNLMYPNQELIYMPKGLWKS